jgi:hypothetical protein
MFSIDKSDVPTTFLQYGDVGYCEVGDGGITCNSEPWNILTDSTLYFNKNNFQSTSSKISVDESSVKTIDGVKVFSTVFLQGGYQYLLESNVGFNWNGAQVPLADTATAITQWSYSFGSKYLLDGLKGSTSLESTYNELLLCNSRALLVLTVPLAVKQAKIKSQIIPEYSTHVDDVLKFQQFSNFIIKTIKKVRG